MKLKVSKGGSRSWHRLLPEEVWACLVSLHGEGMPVTIKNKHVDKIR